MAVRRLFDQLTWLSPGAFRPPAKNGSTPANFALRGTMVVLVDALDRRVHGVTAPELDDRLNGRKAAGEDHRPTLPQRVASLCSHYNGAVHPSYVLAVSLLVAWRNRFVHLEHRANLSRTERQQFLQHAAFLKKELPAS